MPITQSEIAHRLRSARKACHITQANAAKALGVSRSAVSQMETGHRSVSGLELHRLAQLYQRDVREFLEARFEESPVIALFRAYPELRDCPATTESLRRCGELHRELVNLREVLGRNRRPSTIPSYSQSAPKSKWNAVQQGHAAAEDERRRLDLGIAPLPDVTDLLGARGIGTELVDMDDEISGLTLIGADGNALVAANRTHHMLRRRFSFAHEYAHVLLDRERRAILSRVADRTSLMEVRANAFAAAFLMPAEGVRSYVGALSKGMPSRPTADIFDEQAATRVEGRVSARAQDLELHDVVRMAHHFGVSCAAMLYRLKGLRFLTEDERGRLAEGDGAGRSKALRGVLGLSEPDGSDGQERVRSAFVALAIEAYVRGRITRCKLDELGRLVGVEGLGERVEGRTAVPDGGESGEQSGDSLRARRLCYPHAATGATDE